MRQRWRFAASLGTSYNGVNLRCVLPTIYILNDIALLRLCIGIFFFCMRMKWNEIEKIKLIDLQSMLRNVTFKIQAENTGIGKCGMK